MEEDIFIILKADNHKEDAKVIIIVYSSNNTATSLKKPQLLEKRTKDTLMRGNFNTIISILGN